MRCSKKIDGLEIMLESVLKKLEIIERKIDADQVVTEDEKKLRALQIQKLRLETELMERDINAKPPEQPTDDERRF